MAKKTAQRAGSNKVQKASARGARGRAPRDLIISKSRTKAAASMNVSAEFFAALDGAVRGLIARAEQRALDNGRRTLRPHDL